MSGTGSRGNTVVFDVTSDMAAWQEIWQVAANPEGTPSALVHRGSRTLWASLAGGTRGLAALPCDAADRGIFAPWVAQHATAVGACPLVVGRGYDRFYAPDRVYVSLKLPPEPHTIQVVLGWQDHDNRGNES